MCCVAVQGSKGGLVTLLNFILSSGRCATTPSVINSLSLGYVAVQGSKGGQVSLLNIITELKKTCNHPFLFESAEEDYRGGEDDLNAVDRLVVTSGKMVLLDKLMKRLKETGHRCASQPAAPPSMGLGFV